MHELSVAMSLVELATEELGRVRANRAAALYLRVGRLSGVDRHALASCIELAAEGTAVAGARLEIEDVVPAAWCTPCAAERPLDDWMRRRCPMCGVLMAELVRGEELELVRMEIADS